MSTSTTVLVRNISKSLKKEDMADLFGCIGRIAAIDWIEEETENFCRVTFETPDCVKAAMHLHGTPLGDRNLAISPAATSATSFSSSAPAKRLLTPAETIASLRQAAKKLNPQDAASFDEGAHDEEAALIAKTVYIGNISPMADEMAVRAAFADCGNIIYSKMAGNPAVGVKFCFMEFDSPLAAQRAIAKPSSALVIGDRAVKVGPATNPIVKPAEVAVNDDPVRIESAMKRVLRAKRSIEARKSRSRDSRKEADGAGRTGEAKEKDVSGVDGASAKEADKSERHGRRRKRRRSRDGKRSRSRSRSRGRNRRSVSREDDGDIEIVKPRRPLTGRRVGNPTQSQNGLVWDGFTWVTPTGLSVRQKSENLATKIMDVVSADPSALNPASQQALVQQAHQQAALLQAHMSKLRKK